MFKSHLPAWFHCACQNKFVIMASNHEAVWPASCFISQKQHSSCNSKNISLVVSNSGRSTGVTTLKLLHQELVL